MMEIGVFCNQLKGKQLLATFRPDALVVFRAKVKLVHYLKHALCCEDTRTLEVRSGVVFGTRAWSYWVAGQ